MDFFDLFQKAHDWLTSLAPPLTDAEREELSKTHKIEWSCRDPEGEDGPRSVSDAVDGEDSDQRC